MFTQNVHLQHVAHRQHCVRQCLSPGPALQGSCYVEHANSSMRKAEFNFDFLKIREFLGRHLFPLVQCRDFVGQEALDGRCCQRWSPQQI